MRMLLLSFLTAVLGCADVQPDPSATSALTVSTENTATDEAATQIDSFAAAGTACGPNGLVCAPDQTCCGIGPRPPQGVRWVCLNPGRVCDP